jgi:hypothetical protein
VRNVPGENVFEVAAVPDEHLVVLRHDRVTVGRVHR